MCACTCVRLSSPFVFSRGYIELCLCQVPKPPIFPLLCSTSRLSIKFSSCWHFVHPLAPQIFIPAYRSLACGQCWIHASSRFLRLLPRRAHADICMDLAHIINQKNWKLQGSNSFTSPSGLYRVPYIAQAQKGKDYSKFFSMLCLELFGSHSNWL